MYHGPLFRLKKSRVISWEIPKANGQLNGKIMDASRKIMNSQRVTCWWNCSHGWYLDAIPATEQQAHCAKTRCVGRPNVLEKRNSSTMVHHGPSWWICPRDFNELIRIASDSSCQEYTTLYNTLWVCCGSLIVTYLLRPPSPRSRGVGLRGFAVTLWAMDGWNIHWMRSSWDQV